MLNCNKCLKSLPFASFAKCSSTNRGHQYTCKSCCKPIARKNNLRKYGLSLDDFNTLWSDHGGKCAICSGELIIGAGNAGGFAVDHNHRTGAVRGLLCQQCNSGLGCLKDSPAILYKAISYLNDNGHYGPKEA